MVEKLSYRLVVKTEKGSSKASWERGVNSYPWYGLGIYAVGFWLSIVGGIASTIMLFSGGFNGFSDTFVVETAIDQFNKNDVLDWIPQRLQIFRIQLEFFCGFFLGSLFLLGYSAPGEFMDTMKGGKSPEASATRVFERIIFIDQIFEWIRRSPTPKKAKA